MEPQPDLNELFDRDPEALSDQDLDAIIARLRKARQQFELGDKTAGSPKKALAKVAGPIDLTELGL